MDLFNKSPKATLLPLTGPCYPLHDEQRERRRKSDNKERETENKERRIKEIKLKICKKVK